MRYTSLVAGGLLAAAANHPARLPRAAAPVPPPEPRFALVLEHSGSRWAARCEAGCRWTEVTITCPGCAVRLDAAGVQPAAAPRDTALPFAFELRAAPSGRPGGSGWVARGLAGVRWVELSSACGAPVCRARVDEAGVRGL